MPSEAEDPGAARSELDRLAIERTRLENDKLRADIAQAKLAWWKRPAYLGGFTPIMLALLGVFSAWATGYFDSERSMLRTEVEGLAQRRDDLQLLNETLSARNRQLQGTIDEAYLRLKLASASASYALGHLGGLSISPEELERIDLTPVLATLDPPASQLLESLVDAMRFTGEIADITADELEALADIVEAIPASPWARDLQPSGPEGLLLSADGTQVYDLESARFYRREDLDSRTPR